MVRVYLKGGVWKNSEDEILKAAVQKYGKQQWARVASLLNKKTAKQAKARWHEWLDPSIRKTEWSRAEDEKLLHLAKLMPAQWKTIAPLVGRTASQCLEHYEELLDQAAAAAAAAAGSAAGGADTTNLRHQATLKPGQIDSHPETKPARPDPIDMDEDEMEMLQEARARLANTVGKKAKRKQREKMLAQAKRLADLQKRRELKQAGLLSTKPKTNKKRRSKEIDLGAEIPFYKPAPAGFHSTEQEQVRTAAQLTKRRRNVDFQKVNENQYKTRDREAAAAKKREEARMRVLEDSNVKYEKQAAKLDQQQQQQRRPRGLLHLPEPTVTDQELTRMVKEQQQQAVAAAAGSLPTAGATQALLGDYTDRPLPTPMRKTTDAAAATATPHRRDLMQEATQLRALERGQTPLLLPTSGGAEEETMMMTTTTDKEDSKMPATATDAASVATFATSSRSIRELARQERRAAKKARLDLEAALAALPAPQFEYELAVPEAAAETEDGAMVVVETVEDQADVEAAAQEKLRQEAEREFRARSTVLQRNDLPRPDVLSTVTTEDDIQTEALQLMKRDAFAYPPMEAKTKKKKKKRKRDDEEGQQQQQASRPLEPVELETIPPAALEEARNLIQQELQIVMEEKIELVLEDGKASNREDALAFLTEETCCKTSSSLVYNPTTQTWKEPQSDADWIVHYRWELEGLQEATAAQRKKNDKLQAKLSIVHGGYPKRAQALQQDLQATLATLHDVEIEEAVYLQLESHEVPGAASRQEALQAEIAALRRSEAALQKRYGDLVLERRRAKASSS